VLTIRYSLFDLLWSDRKAPLLALQECVLLRQGLPKVLLEGTSTSLRAGLSDAGFLRTSNTQLFQPSQSHQRLISVHISPQLAFRMLLYKENGPKSMRSFRGPKRMTMDER
jgi:hypothetical protein